MTTPDAPATSGPTAESIAEPGAVPGDGEYVDRLTPAMGGRWLVTTRHTTHVWDLRAGGFYERRPGPAGQRMPYDFQPVRLDRVERWPVVGSRALVFYDDPEMPGLEQYRMCSAITSICRLDDEDPARSAGDA